MNEKELRHRLERGQQELEYWRGRADQLRSVLDRFETDYLIHRTDCCVVRRRRLRAAVERTLDVVAGLNGAAGVGRGSSGRSSPTESSSLLTSQPTSTGVTVADFCGNVRRLVDRSHLKCTLRSTLGIYSGVSEFNSALINVADIFP